MKQKFLSGVTLAALTLLVALPLLFILLQAIFPHFSAGSLHDAFGGVSPLLADPQLMSMLGGTLWIAGGVALASVLIGLPLGILRGMFSLPLPRLWDLLFLIPFLTPPYISALSWMLALQRQGYLQQLTGWQLNDLLFSRSGIVLVMTFNIFPVVYFAVSRSLLASGQRLAMVARVHGASAWRAFWHVTLPMLSPALAAGMLLAFTLAIEEFGVPAALGSRAGVVMLTVGIEKKLADWPVDLTGAALLSLLLMAVALFAWWLQTRLVGEKEVTSVTGKPGENRGTSLGWMTLPALLAMAAVGGLAVGVPAASMMLTSLMGTLSGGVSRECHAASFRGAIRPAGRCPVGPRRQPVSGARFGADRRRAGAAGRLAGDGAEDQRARGGGCAVADAGGAAGRGGGGGIDPAVEPALLAALALQHAVDAAALLLLPAAALAGALCRQRAAPTRPQS